MPPNEVLVTIAVDQQTKKLSLFPGRSGEVVVFKKANTGSSPAKPVQVRWVTSALNKDQEIVIDAKKDTPPIFAPQYKLTASKLEEVSGAPSRGPGNGQSSVQWLYSVALMESGSQKDYVDPDVTIRDDP